jgi:DNA-binding CsgD family transcriptional regulator
VRRAPPAAAAPRPERRRKRRLGDDELVAAAELTEAVARFQLGLPQPFDPATTARSVIADLGRADASRHMLLLHWTFVSKYAGDLDRGLEILELARQAVVDRQEDGMLPPILFQLAEAECWAGNARRAEQLLHELRVTIDDLEQTAMMESRWLYLRALVDGHLGRVAEAREAASAGLQLAREQTDPMLEIRCRAARGSLELALGDAPAAAEQLRQGAALAAARGFGQPGQFRLVGDAVEALLTSGAADEARELLAALGVRGAAADSAWARAVELRCRGLLVAAEGDLQDGLTTLRAAAQLQLGRPEVVELGRTLLAAGTLERRLKRWRSARETLGEACALFDRCDAVLWANRARQELARIGGRPAAAADLTATEQRIAQLVAEGRTNRQTAQALFVTVSTVEGALSRIYRKLGVRSRAELAHVLISGEASPRT